MGGPRAPFSSPLTRPLSSADTAYTGNAKRPARCAAATSAGPGGVLFPLCSPAAFPRRSSMREAGPPFGALSEEAAAAKAAAGEGEEGWAASAASGGGGGEGGGSGASSDRGSRAQRPRAAPVAPSCTSATPAARSAAGDWFAAAAAGLLLLVGWDDLL